MMLGLIKPTAGKVERLNLGLRQIGAIIESPAFYPFMSGRDNLHALALALGDVPSTRISDLIEMVGLEDAAHRKYQTYSLGMKQRLGIASTLLADPKLVILDEPTNGLDPAGQQEVRALIPRLASEGRSVLLASHLLNEVEQVCSRVVILRKGKLIAGGKVNELLARHSYVEVIIDDAERARALLTTLPYVRSVSIVDEVLQVDADADTIAAINKTLAEAGLYASSLSLKRSSLEDIFLELTAKPETAVLNG
jgi:ABC-2 type transport system ATP-binding protein